MDPKIRIFKSAEELTGFLISRIQRQLLKKAPGQFYTIALSGGSTPKEIFRIISEKHLTELDWSRIAFFWGDERCVEPKDPESNYRMAYKSLFRYLDIPELNICRIWGECEPEVEAKRYSDRVDFMLAHENGLPRFDAVWLGLGEDGHTASIFPGNIGLFHSENLYETSEHPVTGQKRITATGTLINNSKDVWIIALGEKKVEIISRILEKVEGWEKLPASLVNPTHGQLFWLLDEPAASKIRQKDQ